MFASAKGQGESAIGLLCKLAYTHLSARSTVFKATLQRFTLHRIPPIILNIPIKHTALINQGHRRQVRQELTRLYSTNVVIFVGAFSEETSQCGAHSVAQGTQLQDKKRKKKRSVSKNRESSFSDRSLSSRPLTLSIFNNSVFISSTSCLSMSTCICTFPFIYDPGSHQSALGWLINSEEGVLR